MDFFEGSHYQINKRLLFYLGQWPLQKSGERYFFRTLALVLVGSILVPKLIKFFEYLGDLNGMIQCLPVLGLHTVSGVKFVNYTFNSKKLKELTCRIKDDWFAYGNDPENTIMKRYAERGKLLSVIYTAYMFATLWLYLLLPAVPKVMDIIMPLNHSRNLIYLYETQYYVDQDEYYFPILIHAYMTMPVSLCMIVAFDTMYAVHVHHACGIFATLGKRLENIGSQYDIEKSTITEEPFRDVDYEQIISCIRMHKEALEFAKLIESATSLCFVFVVGICMLMITLTGFMTVTNLDEPSEALRFGAFALGETIHLYYICWQGQMLMEHSTEIFLNAYNVNWCDTSIRSKRLLILIMMRSLIPCRITAGKVYVLSLENFTAAMKTSMSYFTVLLSVQ